MTKIAAGGPKTVFPRGRRDPSEEVVEREAVVGSPSSRSPTASEAETGVAPAGKTGML
ncbi:hypothetical protein [Natronococcus jeotgali]|uniref:hypothetical protein n=1 Tax=Natronococcus jeotgali TaxID=413812 RepID=UPI001360B2AC|nr:hypothetical protein [Natronococcus jeotgali]